MSAKSGVDLNGRGLPAPIFETVKDPEAADQIATGRKSQAAELTTATNQLLLQSTEDSRFDPAPVERKPRTINGFCDYGNDDALLKYTTLALLLVGVFVIIKS
jgi:hypothetical protein